MYEPTDGEHLDIRYLKLRLLCAIVQILSKVCFSSKRQAYNQNIQLAVNGFPIWPHAGNSFFMKPHKQMNIYI